MLFRAIVIVRPQGEGVPAQFHGNGAHDWHGIFQNCMFSLNFISRVISGGQFSVCTRIIVTQNTKCD